MIERVFLVVEFQAFEAEDAGRVLTAVRLALGARFPEARASMHLRDAADRIAAALAPPPPRDG